MLRGLCLLWVAGLCLLWVATQLQQLLSDKAEELESMISSLQQRLSDRDKELEEEESRMNQLELHCQDLAAKLAAVSPASSASPEWRALATMAIGAVALALWHVRRPKAVAAEMEAVMASREQDRARIDGLESQTAERDARSQEEEAWINSLQCRLVEMDEELNARIGSLQGLLSERDEELARLSRRGEVEEARVTSLEQQLSARDEELARLSSRGEEDRATIGSLQHRLSERDEELEKLSIGTERGSVAWTAVQGLAARLDVLEKGLGKEAPAARGAVPSGDEAAPLAESRCSDSQVQEVAAALRHEQEKQDRRIARLEAEREGQQGSAFDMQAFMHASLQQQMLGLQAHVTQLFQEQGCRQPGNRQPSGEQPDFPAAAGSPAESAETPQERRMESQLMQLASVEIERLSKKLRRRTQQLTQLTQASGAGPRSAGQALDSSGYNSCGSSVASFAMTYSREPGSPFAVVRAGPASAATEDFNMVEDAQTRVAVLSEEASVLQSCLVLTFNKYPKKLTEALLASEVAQRLQAEGLDLEPAWANGAKIFVKGLTQEIMEQSDYAPEWLRNCDVVLQEADEEAVLASLSTLQYRVRPRLKCRTALSSSCPAVEAEEEERADEGQSSACQPGPELVVERTFVDFRLPKVITPRSLYTLSSNDKDRRFPNPRKWAPAARAP